MYYADPADEGEPSSGFFYAPAIPFFALCFLICSCQPFEARVKGARLSLTVDSTMAKVKKTKAPPPAPKKKKKRIYLTFDDGPNRGTQNVLDIVQQEAIPVTFFIVGEHVFASPGQGRVWDSLKMAQNIELCNHSYTHAHNRYDRFYEQPDSVVKDIRRTKEELLPDNLIVRAPGRNSWRIDSLHFTDIKKSKAAVDSLQSAGFVVFGWDLEWHYDPKTLEVKSTADEMLSQVDSVFKKGKTKVKDNLVILAHDQVYAKSNDSIQLRDFIQKLKKRDDLELSLVSRYPGIAKEVPDTIGSNLPR